MTTTTPTARDRTAADLLVYRPLDPRLGDADTLAQLRAIRAARSRQDDLDLETARSARRAERDRCATTGAPDRHRQRTGQHRGPGLRLFGHRLA